MSSPSSSEPVSIPVVVLGWKRTNGVVYVPEVLAERNAPYVMTAMVDFVETLEPYRYTPKNLGVILHNLHPRPRALVVGTAVPPSLTDEITAVWNEYVDTVLKEEFPGEEWKKNVCSQLQLFHYVSPETTKHPPKNIGWEREMLRQLDAVFRPEVTWD